MNALKQTAVPSPVAAIVSSTASMWALLVIAAASMGRLSMPDRRVAEIRRETALMRIAQLRRDDQLADCLSAGLHALPSEHALRLEIPFGDPPVAVHQTNASGAWSITACSRSRASRAAAT